MVDRILRFVYLSLPWVVIVGSIVTTIVLVLTGFGPWSMMMLVGVAVGINMILEDYHIGMR